MYRNSAQNFGQVKCIPPHALPSPDNTSDSDVEILDALDEKRRQLDEEISRFQAAKDREFREFEKELRVKRKRSRAGSHSFSEPTPSKQFTSTSAATASVLNLLASSQHGSVNGRARPRAKRDGLGDKVKKPTPLSAPTLSLDKLNITSETTPPLSSLSTPPLPTLLKRSRSRSPITKAVRLTTPPPSQSEKELAPLSTPTPSKDRSDPFAGVFTPAFLPLLESRDQSPTRRGSQPLTSAAEEKERLQLDAESKLQAEKQQLEASQSLPPQQISPTLYATKRAISTPVLPSARSLPSALRSSSGGDKRRKHVMFQLADLKVVGPSSSYQEGPSPELVEEEEAPQSRDSHAHSDEREEVSKGNGSPRMLGEKEKRNGRRRNGRFVSPMPSPLASPSPSPVPSPAFRRTSPSSSPQPSPNLASLAEESGFSNGLDGAEDGGSGVGFFELDEELASPGLRDGNPVENFDLDLEEDSSEKAGAARMGLGIVPSLKVGSVPIDIIRPSGSFIGSYGH